MPRQRIPLNDIPRDLMLYELWQKTGPRTGNNCMEWVGSLATNGYGRIGLLGHRYAAHRAAYIATHGKIPDGFDVCHKCDNRRCVNPAHLFLGTRSDNMVDAANKRRITAYLYPERMPRGERHGRRKLSEADVQEIRTSSARVKDLAAKFGINRTTVRRVRDGLLWGHSADAIRALK